MNNRHCIRVTRATAQTGPVCWAILLIALVNSLSLTLFAANPVGWRMDGSSVFPTAKPPAHWGTTDHVVWATPLPQWSNASPVLVDDKIFVCSEPSLLVCLDLAGKILWQHSLDYSDLPAPPAAELAKNRAAIVDEHLKERLAELQAGIPAKKAELDQAKTDAAANKNDPAAKAKAGALGKELAGLEKRFCPAHS